MSQHYFGEEVGMQEGGQKSVITLFVIHIDDVNPS
jgi:hypothetical protein